MTGRYIPEAILDPCHICQKKKKEMWHKDLLVGCLK